MRKRMAAAVVLLISGALAAVGCGEDAPTGSNGGSAFKLTGEMVEPRLDHTAALLQDGRVLVAGGTDGLSPESAGTLASAELYDPVSGTFSLTDAMPQGRVGHIAVALPDGNVLIAGGGVRAALIYDPVSETFRETGATLTLDGELSAVALSDGRVFLMSSFSDRPEIYDPATGQFAQTSRAGTQRFGNTVTAMADGSVMLIGGGIRLAEAFDPAVDRYRTVAGMLITRYGHAASRLEDGSILITGGSTRASDGLYAPVINAEIYSPISGDFVAASNMAAARFRHTSTLLRNGDVLIAGGSEGASELYRAVSGSFEILNGEDDAARSGATATLMSDGRVLIAGGLTRDYRVAERAVIYTP